jgi:hypothetical protein
MKAKKQNDGARWFALHSLVNVLVSAAAGPDVVRVLASPLCSMVNPMTVRNENKKPI